MRKIKFRAWINKLNCFAEEVVISQVCSEFGYCGIIGRQRFFDCEIEQFTGMNDKNGKEIYEGDLVIATDTNTVGYQDEVQDTVSYIGSGYCLSESWEQLDYFGEKNIEVVGNVHQGVLL
jgi:uncharacterized phage protein (TIGR01671 family)